MKKIFPGSHVSHKEGVARIMHKMADDEIKGERVFLESWKYFTDILRANIECKNSDEVIEVIKKMKADKVFRILRLKPRFGE